MSSHRILDNATRQELIERAHELRIEKPERMTRAELRDEIIRLTEAEAEQAQQRGLFGVARSMLASVVEAGLKLPDAATAIRGDSSIAPPVRSRAPVATVTLAEIYVAQGHRGRAKKILEQILAQEPDHAEAQRVLEEIRNLRSQTSEIEGTETGSVSRDEPSKTQPDVALSAPMASAPHEQPAAGTQEVEGLSVGHVPETVETFGHEIESVEPPTVEEIDAAVPSDSSEIAEKSLEKPQEVAGEDAEPSADFIIEQTSAFLDLKEPVRLYFELAEVSALRFADDGLVLGLCAQLVMVSPRLGLPKTEYFTLVLPQAKVGDVETLRGVVDLAHELPEFKLKTGVSVRAAIGVELPSGFLPLCVAETVGRNPAIEETPSLQRARSRALVALSSSSEK